VSNIISAIFRTRTSSFAVATIHLFSFEIYERGLQPTGRFPYNNLTTPYREGCPYLPPGDVLNTSVGLSSGNIDQYSAKIVKKIIRLEP
jgi:hypothetical protein